MRKVGVVTVGRSDWGIYQSLLRALQAAPDFELQILVTGMHLVPEFGLTVKAIESEGFAVAERVEMLLASDTPGAVAKSMGLGVAGWADVFARARPDLLVVLGDRFEMYAAALAALPFQIPLVHLHGGEVTHGAIDEALRHSMTKLSHLHFVSTADSARRVIQLGEEPWRVTVSGAPALDALDTLPFLSRNELSARFGLRFASPPLLVTFHPVTVQHEQVAAQTEELLAALDEIQRPVIFTGSNADTGGRVARTIIDRYVAARPDAQFVENLGQLGYFSLMREASAMVGNSSSGLIEAGSFGLPVVNIGNRQGGRLRGPNVIDVGHSRGEIVAGLRRALSEEFRAALAPADNPYRVAGRSAAEIIVERLRSIPIDRALLFKRFHDAA